MKLYRAWSTVKSFNGYKDVEITWYCAKREKPVLSFESLIENYEPNDEYTIYAQDYVNELFTENELRELKRYLSKFHDFKESEGEILFYVQETIPCPSNSYPLAGIPSDLRHGSIILKKESDEDLSFPLYGYYDLSPYMEEANFSTASPETDSRYVEEEYIDDLPF